MLDDPCVGRQILRSLGQLGGLGVRPSLPLVLPLIIPGIGDISVELILPDNASTLPRLIERCSLEPFVIKSILSTTSDNPVLDGGVVPLPARISVIINRDLGGCKTANEFRWTGTVISGPVSVVPSTPLPGLSMSERPVMLICSNGLLPEICHWRTILTAVFKNVSQKIVFHYQVANFSTHTIQLTLFTLSHFTTLLEKS